MITSHPYSGDPIDVPFGPIKPPKAEADVFVANVQRRCPPIEVLAQAKLPIRVIGVLPMDFASYAQQNGWTCAQTDPTQPLWDGTSRKAQRSKTPVSGCSHRPALWHMRDAEGSEFLVCCTAPSREAVSHWASMLDQLLRCSNVQQSIQALWHESSTERFVSKLLSESKLVDTISEIQRHNGQRAILLVGYTNMLSELVSKVRTQQRSVDLAPHFKITAWEAAGRAPLIALTVRFSFRGTLGTELFRQIGAACDLGGLAFFTKVSQHISSDYKQCIIPGQFLTLSAEGRLPKEIGAVRQLLPNLASRAVHLSTPSTLLSRLQIEEAAQLGAYTTGNEVSYLAQGCASIPFIAVCQSDGQRPPMLQASSIVVQQLSALGKSFAPSHLGRPQSDRIQRIYGGKLISLPLSCIDAHAHSMGEGFESYVAAKNPPVHLYENLPVKVIGVAAEDLEAYARKQKWTLEASLWSREQHDAGSRRGAYLRPKHGNHRRATLHRIHDDEGKKFCLLNTMPSKELVLHWGTLIRQKHENVEALYHADSEHTFANACVQESELSQQLGQHRELTSGEALLVMGYGELTAQLLCGEGYTSPYAAHEEFSFRNAGNGLSYCLLTKHGHQPVVLVNVDFCYWGGLSGALARSIIDTSRFSGLVHIAKAGQMAGPNSLQQVYCPRSFTLMTAENAPQATATPKMLFAESGTTARLTGDHISFASTLLETTELVQQAKAFGSVSVDVEGAHFCQAAADAGVAFGALYFASDYVRSEAQSGNPNEISLVSDIADQAEHKETILQQAISKHLMPVLRKE